jgi:hypothetical protein
LNAKEEKKSLFGLDVLIDDYIAFLMVVGRTVVTGRRVP